MMANDELTRSLSQLFGGTGSRYNIPDYQRGYEWSREDVELLLDDLRNFTDRNEDGGKFYCLQHITLVKSGDVCIVVDGQQRLTTLAIILSYFGRGDMFRSRLSYSVREETGRQLEEFIFSGEYWKENGRRPADGHKDWYYIMEAADSVRDWAEAESNTGWLKGNRDNFVNKTLLEDAKLLLNSISAGQGETDGQRIFANINGAKAELDGADLLRAMQITRAAREKAGCGGHVDELRVKMGMELDAINAWCGGREVREYLKLLLPDYDKSKTGFDTGKYPIGLLYQMIYEMQKGKERKHDFSFRFFEYGLDVNKNGAEDNNLELYEKLKEMYSLARDWYSDKVIYHYSAYLFAQFKQYVRFSEIFGKWMGGTRKSLREALRSEIARQLLNAWDDSKDVSDKEKADSLREALAEVNRNWYGDYRIYKILILCDVVHCCASESVRRMAVRQFSSEKEDKEHIGSQTPNLADINDSKKWEDFWREIRESGLPIGDERRKRIEEKIRKMQSLNEGDEKNQALESIVSELNSIGLGSIGNIVLLDRSINRGYGNASFANKKLAIIQSYFERKVAGGGEVLIRPHTLHVFAGERDSRWTFQDIKDNAGDIAEMIYEFVSSRL